MIPEVIDEMWNVGVHSKIVRLGTPCDTYPCWNNGFCIANNSTQIGYECLCNEFYNGIHCENRVIETFDKNCDDSRNSVKCVWRGILDKLNTSTSSIRHCQTNICYNDGICITSDGIHSQCLCSVDFGGNLCSEKNTSGIDIDSLKIFCYLIGLFIIFKIILFFCYSNNFGCCSTISRKDYKYSRWYLPDDFSLSHDRNVNNENYEAVDPRCRMMTFDQELAYIRLRNLGFIPEFDRNSDIPNYDNNNIKKDDDDMVKICNNHQSNEYYEMTMKISTTTDTFLDLETINEEETDIDFI
uniref:EGF-like domain-containing protein n=1 Tax=Strongyloides venezuelensis TaxID=75913 RepID=A0A0K0FE55_STRVS